MTEEKKEGKLGAVVGVAKGAVKLDWVRPLIWRVGGRKMVMGGGALAIVQQIVAAGDMTWPRAIACLAVSIIAIGGMFSVGMEDASRSQANGEKEGK
jgi:hypothetical protein